MSSKPALALAAGCVLASHLYGLDPHRAVTQYALDIWTTRQGLPQNSVRAFAQARDGYLWLGTQAGPRGRYTIKAFRPAPDGDAPFAQPEVSSSNVAVEMVLKQPPPVAGLVERFGTGATSGYECEFVGSAFRKAASTLEAEGPPIPTSVSTCFVAVA